MIDFGRTLACRLLINRVRVLGSGPLTPTHFCGEYPPGSLIYSTDREDGVSKMFIISLLQERSLFTNVKRI